MLRSLLLFLSERERLKDAALRVPALRRVAERFVAGDRLEEALAAARELNEDGLRVTLDLLGESVSNREEAKSAAGAYVDSLDRIAADRAESTISLKLTQLGLDIDLEFCVSNLRRVVGRAAEHDNFVRIDMESSQYVRGTLAAFRRVWGEHRNVGVVIQSCLRRSEEDVRELTRAGAPVRLVKGAYQEPPQVAYQDKREVDESFVRLMRRLLDSDSPTAVATHDQAMIDATLEHMEARGLEHGDVEFQMLYGIRRQYQRELAEEGHPVRVYVPYGSDWYPYLMRRMAERPANLGLVAQALVRG